MTTISVLTLGGKSATLGFLGAERGERVEAPGGATGRFVGRRGGLDWVCYGDDAGYRTMCETFDRDRTGRS